MLKRFGLYLLLLLGLVSCNIKEDLSNCPGTILLDYTSYPDLILDEIEPDEKVHIYIFDRDGICDRIYQFTYGELEAIKFEFQVPIQYRDCWGVVWHGNTSSDYNDESMDIGKNMREFNLSLVNTTIGHQPQSLWASPLEPIDYCASKSRHRIHMTRIHTDINVNLRQSVTNGSPKELDMDDYITTVSATNNCYQTDYTLDNICCITKFNNSEELANNSYLDWARVGTLRITPDMNCMLTVAPVDNPSKPITIAGATQIDLVEYMLKSRRVNRAIDESISDQRFLDLNKVWNIDLLVKPSGPAGAMIAVSLTINGWTVWFDSTDL